jgi:NADH dehydrogenase
VVIIGAGYAGVMAANRLRSSLTDEEAEQIRIVIINPLGSFVERIRLHEVAAGTTPTGSIPLTDVLHCDVQLLEGTTVLIDPVSQVITAETAAGGRTLHYDFLVYAVGSLASTSVPGVSTYAHTIADADGALRTRAAIQNARPGKRIVIVGGGFTSIEAASEIAENHPDAAITLLCGGELADSMTPRARASIRKSLERLNVMVRSGVRVVSVAQQGISTDSGEQIVSDICIWAASFAVPELADVSGLATDSSGRLRVDACLRAWRYPNIIGAGDAAVMPSAVGSHVRMGCAAALPMGSFAARTILAQLRGVEPEPASIGYALQCLSLGRLDSYIQVVGPDDSPRRLSARGRTGAWMKEAVCRMTVSALQEERIRPGAYKAPKGPRTPLGRTVPHPTTLAPMYPEVERFTMSADHVDAVGAGGSLSLREGISNALSWQPAWLKLLFLARGGLARVMRLEHPSSLPDRGLRPEDVSFRSGDRLGFFTISAGMEDAFIVLTAEDTHLIAHLILEVEPEGRELGYQFRITTAVHYRRWTGPLYYNVIRPFHHVIMRRMVSAALTSPR